MVDKSPDFYKPVNGYFHNTIIQIHRTYAYRISYDWGSGRFTPMAECNLAPNVASWIFF